MTPRNVPHCMLCRMTASAVALILAASGTPAYTHFAYANEVEVYEEQRDAAKERAEAAEAKRKEAQAKEEEAERQRTEAAQRADDAARERDAAGAEADAAKDQLEAARSHLDDLYHQLEQAYAELSKAEYDVDKTQKEIDELSKHMEQGQTKLDASKESLAELVSATYRSGKVDVLSLVFGSESFDQLVSRLTYANRISEQQVDAIHTVKELRLELQDQQSELLQKQAEQQELAALQKEKADEAESAERAQQEYVAGLAGDLVAALDAERAAAADESRARADEVSAAQTAGSAHAEAAEQEQTASEEREKELEAERNRAAAMQYIAQHTVPSAVARSRSTATGDQRLDAVNAALTQVGVSYGFGCENPGVAFDCNSLTHWAWAQAGVEIPYGSGRTCYGQFQWMLESGRWVTNVEDLQPGDLVFYSYDGGLTTYHVALYIGGGQVVHANGYRYGVMVSDIFFDDGFCGGGSPL